MESVRLRTSDGRLLGADLARPAGAAIGTMAICHPHPLYGGSRHDLVVTAVFDRAVTAGFVALRFDFRADHDGGRAERLDLVAALDELTNRDPELPLAVVGYSFGAMVALSTADPRVAAIVAISPPLAMTDHSEPPGAPVLVLCPRHDQFSPPSAAEPIVAGWSDAELEIVESADHFLHGRRAAVAERAIAWLVDRRDVGLIR